MIKRARWQSLQHQLEAQLRDKRCEWLKTIPDLQLLIRTSLFCLTLAVLMTVLHNYHVAFYTLNHLGMALPPAFWANATYPGDTLVALVLLLLFARHYPELLWVMVLAAVFGTLYTHGLKNLFDAARPPAVLAADSFQVIGPAHHSGSFPSGHTLTIFTFAAVLVERFRSLPLRVALLLFASLVGLSRVMVGVHWPVDVLVGAAGGCLSAWFGFWLGRWWGWGLRPVGHLFLLSLLIVAAFLLMSHHSGYPEAKWMNLVLPMLGLGAVLHGYLPLLYSRCDRPATSLQRALEYA